MSRGGILTCARCGRVFTCSTTRGMIPRFCGVPCCNASRHPCACGCGQYPSRWNAEYVRGHRPPLPPKERFWRFVTPQPGCWEWQGAKNTKGYGQIGRGHRDEGLVLAHRLSYEMHHGPIPIWLMVRHSCDNPPCVNPAHLSLGTDWDNMADARSKGRTRGAEGLTNWNGRLTIEQVAEIRRRYVRGEASALAAEFGITPQYVGQLAAGKWRKTA